jgi:hypothetical protein
MVVTRYDRRGCVFLCTATVTAATVAVRLRT